jgi:cell wall-associated NlpC family hydrolase
MGLLHRLRRRWIRLGRPAVPAPRGRRLSGRFPLPTTFSLHSPATLFFALALGAAIFWFVAADPARAVDETTTTEASTTTTIAESTTTTTDLLTTTTDVPTTTTTTVNPTTTTTTRRTTTTWWTRTTTVYPWWTVTTTYSPPDTTLSQPVQIQVDALTAQAQNVQAQIDALTDELEQKTEGYNKCLDDLDGANARMGELRRRIADAQADKAHQQAQLAERLKTVYKSGGRDQLLQLLLLADSMEDLYNRVRIVTILADQDRRLVSNLKDSSTRLDLLLKAVDEQKSQQLALRKQLSTRATEIQATVDQKETMLAGLDARVKAIVDQERQRQIAEQQQLQREFEARLQAAMLAAQTRVVSVLNGGQVYQGTLPQTDNATLNQVLETAASYMGIPYVWGGSQPSTGMDCSGFVRYVFKQHGVDLPHYSGYQAQMGVPVTPADIQPGDLVAFGFPVHHVGIYIGDGLFIHTPGDYVKISKMSSRSNLAAIRRFPLELRTGAPLLG